MDKLLEVKDLIVEFGDKRVVDRVSFSIEKGEVLGIVGESGSGKTITSLSIMRLTPESAKVKGSIIFEGKDLTKLSEQEMRKIRGKDISIILQNPHSAFNPVFRVGYQVMEPLFIHYSMSRSEAEKKVLDTFKILGISEPGVRMRNYPHELSGGMKQRAVIAVSMVANAKLIIADEPITALDPTIASQILKILRNLVDENKKSMIFISHDISAAGWISDKIAVMYGGWIVELGKREDVLSNPLHPYTKALIQAIPRGKEKPKPIPGSPLDINQEGCRFAKRCVFAKSRCFKEEPRSDTSDSRMVKCFFPLKSHM